MSRVLRVMLRPARRSLPAIALIASLVVLLGAGVASAAPPKALINEATVSGGASSQEAQIATAKGFAVTVVSDATWATMTQAEFGQYDLLIAGDPTCGQLPPGLVASAPTYGPVVLGHAGGRTQAGNRIVVGTDPVLHDGGDYTSPNARGTIIRDGIGFAGLQPGRTGMYFDSTCAANYFGQSAETLAILTALSEGSGAWTIDSTPPCGGAVSLIASHPAFSDLTTASLQGWSCSVHESFPTYTSDWSALAVATDTPSHPTCGVDPNTGTSACGEAYLLIAGSSIVIISGSISLTPADATNAVGTDHTVTAHVSSGGSPLAGQLVTFTVTGQNAGATGTCVPASCASDSSGNVSFTYHDANGAGDDTVKASFTDAAGSLQSATAQKHWVSGGETTPPSCALSKMGTNAAGKKFIEVTVRDTGSGLGSVVVLKSVNSDTVVPPFAAGTTSPVVVTSTKVDQTKSAQVELKVTDVAGNAVTCDPVLTTLVGKGNRTVTQRFRGLPGAESKIRITNGRPGLRKLVAVVNGRRFEMRKLANGAKRTVDVSRAMRAGNRNTIVLHAKGSRGASTDIVISD
jgi:hypothetical protein